MARKGVYVAGNGQYGCLYDSSEEFTSYKEACGYLIDLFDLKGPRRAGELRRNGSLDLRAGEGAQYCEITWVADTK